MISIISIENVNRIVDKSFLIYAKNTGCVNILCIEKNKK